jgi:3-dehydroquinate synthase
MNNIIFTRDIRADLQLKLADFGIADIFVLVDNNSRNFCQRSFEDFGIPEEHIITIPEGEHHKSLESVAEIWQVLSDQGARRNAVLVNVGGGVITDLGGFAASCFKRGIHCVNIPTTLLAQIDASVGGKTGFDFNGLKNEIGSFAIPDWVLIDNHFLATLPERQIMSGFAEMLKHALLADEEHVAEAMQVDFAGVAEEDFLKLIRKSVAVKAAIVQSDPREKGLRKALNFGHTVGHAIESVAIRRGLDIFHGDAVAYGMIAELFLSLHAFFFQAGQDNLSFSGDSQQFIKIRSSTPIRFYPVRNRPVFSRLHSDHSILPTDFGSKLPHDLQSHIDIGTRNYLAGKPDFQSFFHIRSDHQ